MLNNLITQIRNITSKATMVDYKKDRENEWQYTGMYFRKERETRGILVTHMANFLGVSVAKLRRFENGEPILSAKQMETTYKTLLTLIDLQKDFAS